MHEDKLMKYKCPLNQKQFEKYVGGNLATENCHLNTKINNLCRFYLCWTNKICITTID